MRRERLRRRARRQSVEVLFDGLSGIGLRPALLPFDPIPSIFVRDDFGFVRDDFGGFPAAGSFLPGRPASPAGTGPMPGLWGEWEAIHVSTHETVTR